MQATATHKYLRIAPRKVRLVADLIKGKKVSEAEYILRVIPRGAAQPLKKVLRAAVASAKTNSELDENNLYVAKLAVGEGPKLKRYRPRARGRAYPIEKKTSHIMLMLREITPTDGIKPKKKTATPGATKETEPAGKTQAKQTKPRAAHDMTKPKAKGVAQRMFRRKAI